MCLPFLSRVKDQGETKDEPRNDQRTLKQKKTLFIKILLSLTSLIPFLLPPRDDRENTEGTPHQLPVTKRCCLLISPSAICLRRRHYSTMHIVHFVRILACAINALTSLFISSESYSGIQGTIRYRLAIAIAP